MRGRLAALSLLLAPACIYGPGRSGRARPIPEPPPDATRPDPSQPDPGTSEPPPQDPRAPEPPPPRPPRSMHDHLTPGPRRCPPGSPAPGPLAREVGRMPEIAAVHATDSLMTPMSRPHIRSCYPGGEPFEAEVLTLR